MGPNELTEGLQGKAQSAVLFTYLVQDLTQNSHKFPRHREAPEGTLRALQLCAGSL